MALNLTAPLIIVQQAVQRGFGKERPGVVVNMSTVGAQQPQQGIGAYCTSMAALEMLTKVLALELGAQGIRVNAVATGLVATETDRKSVVEGKRVSVRVALGGRRIIKDKQYDGAIGDTSSH